MAFQKEIPPLPRCLVGCCDSIAKTRGLCGCCYTTASKAVNNNVVTWEELEAMGLSLAPHRKRRPISNAFSLALTEKMAQVAPSSSRFQLSAAQRAQQTIDLAAERADQIDRNQEAVDLAKRIRGAADLAKRRANRAELRAEQQAAAVDQAPASINLTADAVQRNEDKAQGRLAHRERVAARQVEATAPVIPESDMLPIAVEQPQEPSVVVPGAHAASEAPAPEAPPEAPKAPVLPWQVKQNTAPGGSKPK